MRVSVLSAALALFTTAFAFHASTAAAQEVSEPPRFELAVSAGGSARALFDSYVFGGEGAVSAGVASSVGSYALRVGGFGGVVEGGLTTLHIHVGFDMAWELDIIRIGLTPRIGYLGIERFTIDRQFGAYTFGLAGQVSVDVFRDESLAFAIGIEPTADVAAALGNDGADADGAAPFVGGRGFLEVRWQAPPLGR